MDNKAKRLSINELHTTTRVLINFLEMRLIKDGAEMVSYKELTAAIGGPIQEARGYLNTARRAVEDKHNILLETVFGSGIKKSGDLSGTLDRSLKHIRRAARRTNSRVLNAVTDTMDNAVKTEIFSKTSAMGAIQMFTQPKAIKQIQGVVQTKLGELAVAETLKLFSK